MIPRGNSFIIELTYQKKEEKEPVLLDRDEGAFIDLGVNNFAAIVTTKSGVITSEPQNFAPKGTKSIWSL